MNGICLALFQQFPKQKKPVSVHAYLDERKAQIACLKICIADMVKRAPYCTNIKKVANIEYVGIHGPTMERTPRR